MAEVTKVPPPTSVLAGLPASVDFADVTAMVRVTYIRALLVLDLSTQEA